jgi:hypothetical protein
MTITLTMQETAEEFRVSRRWLQDFIARNSILDAWRATGKVVIGREARLQGSTLEGPEWRAKPVIPLRAQAVFG